MSRKNLFLSLMVLVAFLWVSPFAKAQHAEPSPKTAKEAGPTPTAPAAPVAAPAGQEAPAMNYKYEAKGRRDPFRNLDVATSVQAASAPIVRPPGLKGQLVSEITLVGIVKKKGLYTALSTGYRGKTFFIHSNDDLYDGKVIEIRNDTVILNQYLTDSHGKKITQQIVKKLYPTRGEGTDAK
jgi:Tfp pilus assembly protein PilP